MSSQESEAEAALIDELGGRMRSRVDFIVFPRVSKVSLWREIRESRLHLPFSRLSIYPNDRTRLKGVVLQVCPSVCVSSPAARRGEVDSTSSKSRRLSLNSSNAGA